LLAAFERRPELCANLSGAAFLQEFGMDIIKGGVAGTMESSDIMITIEPGTAGIEIDLQSVVEKQFGGEIRRAILETLAELSVRDARISAVDKGALDCTIRARTKTAVFRAGGQDSWDWRAGA
jgi:citrate lyase subunit gamma (acyl carrier protein)